MTLIKKSLLILLAILIKTNGGFAQIARSEYIYFDNNWKQVSGTNYSFFRKVNYNSKGEIINPITDYFSNGRVQCTVYCDQYTTTCGDYPTSCGMSNGTATWYFQSGDVRSENRYKRSQLISKIDYSATGAILSRLGCVSGDCDNGYGVYYYSKGDKYSGNFVNGLRHGQGTYTWASSGQYYAGRFQNNQVYKTNTTAEDILIGLEIAIKLVELGNKLFK